MSQIDDAFRTAQSLDPDDRLRLIVRLWKSLPRDHRDALATLQIEESLGATDRPTTHGRNETLDLIWSKINEWLFDIAHTSDLYSAPRRFDLATIFVVTAAYSLLFGGLSAIGAIPAVKIVVGALITIIAAAQALLQHRFNPRGASIIAGAIALPVLLTFVWLGMPYRYRYPFILVTFFFGVPVGAFSGYLLGTVVGGVFLVADALRGKFEGRAKVDATNDDDVELAPLDESKTDSAAIE